MTDKTNAKPEAADETDMLADRIAVCETRIAELQALLFTALDLLPGNAAELAGE